MGAKATTIWYIDAADPKAILRDAATPDWNAAISMVARLFPEFDAVPTEAIPLAAASDVDADHVFVGCYPGVTVVCSAELTSITPSTLSTSWTHPAQAERTYLVASDPVNAWGAFASWERGEFRRSFSATPIYIYEDLGLPLIWERPFWAGDHPLQYPDGVMPDPQSLPFHPQQFAESANVEWLGFRYTGAPHEGELDPNSLPVCGFALYPLGQAPRAQPEPQPAPELVHATVGNSEGAPAPTQQNSAPRTGKLRRWLGLEKKV